MSTRPFQWPINFLALFATLALAACVMPSAVKNSQTMPLQVGDDFKLIAAPKPNGTIAPFDTLVTETLSNRFHPSGKGRLWLVEYSYAVRPAKVTMKIDGSNATVVSPKSDALMECGDLSHKLNLRIVSATDGQQAYISSAEVISCGEKDQSEGAIFNQLLSTAIVGLRVE